MDLAEFDEKPLCFMMKYYVKVSEAISISANARLGSSESPQMNMHGKGSFDGNDEKKKKGGGNVEALSKRIAALESEFMSTGDAPSATPGHRMNTEVSRVFGEVVETGCYSALWKWVPKVRGSAALLLMMMMLLLLLSF